MVYLRGHFNLRIAVFSLVVAMDFAAVKLWRCLFWWRLVVGVNGILNR
jgi:hypothetical protein